MYNLVVLVGRLVADPERRSLPDGRPVASMRLAVDRPGRPKERETDFVRIVAFDRTADFALKYLTKGRLILVEGRLRVRRYVDNNGQNRLATEVVARNIQFMDKKPEGVAPTAPPTAVSEQEVPFEEFEGDLDYTEEEEGPVF